MTEPYFRMRLIVGVKQAILRFAEINMSRILAHLNILSNTSYRFSHPYWPSDDAGAQGDWDANQSSRRLNLDHSAGTVQCRTESIKRLSTIGNRNSSTRAWHSPSEQKVTRSIGRYVVNLST